MTQSPATRHATLRMTLAMILSGSIGVLVVESGENAVTVVFWRCLLGAMAIAAYVVLTRRVALRAMSLRTWSLMALSGITMAANWVFFFKAYSHAPISTVTIVYHLYPFILILAAGLFFGERVRAWSLCWALVAFLGVVIIATGSGGDAGIDLSGIALTSIAMIFYASTLLIAKRLQAVPPELVSAMQLMVGALALLPYQTASGGDFGAQTWVCLVTLGIVHTGLLYVLLYGAVQKLSTSAVALMSFLYPATALGFDVVVYGLRPGPVQGAGILLIVGAVLAERLGQGGSQKLAVAVRTEEQKEPEV